MPISRNALLDGGPTQALGIVYGFGALAPDPGGGILVVAHPGLAGAVILASYDVNQLFVAANAGFLMTGYDVGTGSILIQSSNVADNNGVRWVAIL